MWYSAGTVAVTANSATITGTGTAFSANARVGDAFRGPDGRWYEVTNIASATVLSIRPNYQGTTASGQAYAIAPMQGYVKESADRLRQLVDQFGAQLAALQSWATAATADMALTELGGSTTGTAVFKAATAAAGRTALGLGTAATANVQTSPTDTTPGALMAVGAFGLGTSNMESLPVGASLSDMQSTRLFQTADGSPPDFPVGLGLGRYPMGLHFQRSTAVRSQFALGFTGCAAYRVTDNAGTLSAWRKMYDTSNILGTVSQSGGVPTGAIIERGSNANGEYVRWADGTQICTNSNGAITANPAAFIGVVTSVDGNKLRIGRWF